MRLPRNWKAAWLPALSYTGLGMATAGSLRVIAPYFATAWHPIALLGASIGIPALNLLAQCLWLGGPGVAKMLGAKESTDTHLLELARRAADAVGVKKPDKVYELDKKEPNAFAASGVLPSQPTAVAVTTGLRAILSEDELSAVLAHEMGHLAHHDVARNMHVAIASAGLGGIFEAGRILVKSSSRGREERKRSSSKSKDDDSGGAATVGLGLMAGGLVLQGVAHSLRLAASRHAELQADQAAAAAFGADSLVSALQKINQHAASQPADLRGSSRGRVMAHAMISDGPSVAKQQQRQQQESWPARVGRQLGGALRTHPTLDTRIAALEQAVESGVVPAKVRGVSWW